MTTDEMKRMLVQIVNEAKPEELASQIERLTPLSSDQAMELAEVIVAHGKLQKEVAEIAGKGGVVEIPPEMEA